MRFISDKNAIVNRTCVWPVEVLRVIEEELKGGGERQC
jgi:hypothetical protein